MKPGRELDALIAEKVFSNKVTKTVWGSEEQFSCLTLGEPDYCYTSDEPAGILVNEVPRYSEDIAAAWEVVENHTYPRLWFDQVDAQWVCHLTTGDTTAKASADTAPHAICLAALKAVGV